ncbi:MAG TPA: hypothetical protein VI479_11805 [Blastocatellia bacterium]
MTRWSILFSVWTYGVIGAAGILGMSLVHECFPSAWYDLQISDLLGIRLHGSL